MAEKEPENKIQDERVETRDKWGGQLDFILSCLGYAVGLGNVWRFPYLCGRSGGAAFLIPYFIMMLFAGMPTFYLELAIGQYCSLTPHIMYRRMCPIFSGIGYTMVTISFITGVYYNMIIAWALYYLGASFTSTLPWSHCTNKWNTPECYDDKVASECVNGSTTYYLGSCQNDTLFNATMLQYIKSLTAVEGNRIQPANEYLNNRVLYLSEGLGTLGTPSWELVLALLAAWILIFFCLMHGVKSSGKARMRGLCPFTCYAFYVVYFTATFPYVILFVLLIRGVTLEGAIDGIKFYMIPDMEKLKSANVWGDAAVQIFFSLSLGGGGLTTLASYNKFHNNLLRDTLIVVFGNCLTSIFAVCDSFFGFVIFSILGFVSKQILQPVEDLAASGPSLAFVAYPDALTRLPASPVWAVLFFFMLILLGIDSQLVIVEVVITCIIDQWPSLRPWRRKVFVVAGVCCVSFGIGIILTCPGGPYILNLMDTYAGGWPLVMSCLVEICMVSYVYGIRRFIGDIRMMLGVAPNRFWTYLGYPINLYWTGNWAVLSPCLLLAVLLFNFISYEPSTYGRDYHYPGWGDGIGWGMAALCVFWIPFVAFVLFLLILCHPNKNYNWLVTPSPQWGPSDMNERLKLAQASEMKKNVNKNLFIVSSSYDKPPPYPEQGIYKQKIPDF